jgi:Zn-dependent peptidase ImmA (M78 family)
MSKKPLEVVVNHAVLTWARESAGRSAEDAAAHLKVSKRELEGWESGAAHPSYTALEAMAAQYKRPLAALLLAEPPQEPPPPADFRALPGKKDRLASETLLAIRRARRLQGLARELMQALGRPVAPVIATASLDHDPKEVASAERRRLGVSIDEQTGWKSPHEAFRRWRTSLEEKNLLVLQFPMPLEDCRGFSLTDQEPLALVVNSADAIQARIFTLFHEYGHLLLRTPGICLPEMKESRGGHRRASTELWCNRFAAGLLVPPGALELSEERSTSDDTLADLVRTESRRLKVSREVILRSMLDRRVLGRAQFLRMLRKIHFERREPKRTGGFASPAERAVRERGRLLSSLILEGLQSGLITYADAADSLSLRLKHLGDVQSLLAA